MNSAQLIANRFELHGLLGRGGMGEVYRATDKQTGETVAVKALNPEVLEHDPSLLERFVREGEALRQLNHPNIVRMVAAVEEEGRHYLVMEFVEGGSLRDMLDSRGCLSASEVVKIALEVADALTRAHHLKIIHRDLKPANVLLAKDNTPHLADFGIAHVQDSSHLTQSGTLIGTVDYLSPEVCQGEQPNELSDIWAFGVMLFEMLSGKLPFEGKSMTAKITAILHQPVPDLTKFAPEIPNALIDLIYRMLEKDHHQRIPSVRLVAADLEGILKGRKPTSSGVAAPLPSFDGGLTSRPVFVGRENELKQLDKALGKTLSGHGQAAFIIGDPGQGKTALLQEFGQRAQKTYTGLVVASGNCNAFTGIGDPYLPFREIMGMLTGDVETLKEAGVIGQTQATRLWNTFPHVIQHLIESGNNLVDIFVPGADLLRRAGSIPTWPDRETWLPQLEGLVARKASQSIDPSLQQAALFEQFTRLTRALAGHAPLILLLDDLQWADSGSINLLSHLGKKLEGSRVMVVGAYRPTEIALGRGGERHPLEAVVNELKRQFGEIEIDLSQAEGRAFVNSLLDTELNRLDESFREEFFRISGGHPLTTIELLRDMQERGGLMKNAEGFWVTGSALNWETLPVRVEATIAERMGRLDEQERSILRVASVQGEGFSAEVTARVLEVGEAEVVTCLSRKLDREHHLVSAQGIRQVNDQRMSFYRFRHILFQKYLYNSLDAVECAHLHQQVGNTLQALYGNDTEEIAMQLAVHFQKAGTNLKAADYLSKAGDRAHGMIAHEDAIEHYQEAMTAYRKALGDEWDRHDQALLEYKIGESFFRRGNHTEALRHFEQALIYWGEPLPDTKWGIRLAILREVVVQSAHRLLPRLLIKPIVAPPPPIVDEINPLYTDCSWILGESNVERALLINIARLNVSESYGYGLGMAGWSAAIGAILQFISALALAESYHLRAIDIAERIQDPIALSYAYGFMGLYCIDNGDPQSAIAYLSRAIACNRDSGNVRDEAYSSEIMGSALWQIGKLAEAEQLCKDLLQTGRDMVSPQICCWAQSKMGHTLRRLGKIEEAVEALQESFELGGTVPDYIMRIEAGAELGRCFLRQGKLAKAISVLEAAERTYFEHDIRWDVTTDLYNALVETYLTASEQSDPTIKATYLEKAKRASRTGFKLGKGSRSRLPDTMWMYGRYEWVRGKPDAARKWWQKGLALAKKQGELYDLASIHAEMGSRFKDKIHLERAKEIFSQIGAGWDLEQTQEALNKL